MLFRFLVKRPSTAIIMSILGIMLNRVPGIITTSTLSACLKNPWQFSTTSWKMWRSALGANYATGDSRPTCPVKEDLKQLSEEEWAQRLTPEQFHVCRANGTEPPFSGKYYTHSEPGIYTCSCCGAALFRSETKYDSGSGWPSFHSVLNSGVTERMDRSAGMSRTEVLCARCNSHLGHKFPDGPEPTGLRYCINSVCLNFVPTVQSSTSTLPPGRQG